MEIRKVDVMPIMHGADETFDYVSGIAYESTGTRLRLYHGIIEYLELLKNANNNSFEGFKIYCDGYDGSQQLDLDKRSEDDYEQATQLYLLSLLTGMGGRLMPTENKSLIRQTIALIEARQRRVYAGSITPEDNTMRRLKGLAQQRDNSISKKIDETLKVGEYGLLFIGSLHNPMPFLEKRGIATHVPKEVFQFLSQRDLQQHPYLNKYRLIST